MPSIICLLTACEGKEPLYQEQGYVFGTLVDVTVYGESEPRARRAASEVLHEFQRLHNMLHAWQLNELNAAFAKGESKAVLAELAAMLQDAAQLSQQSQGLFNPAIGGLVQLWGFHANEFKAALPDEKQIAALVAAQPQMSDLVFNPSRPPLVRGGEVAPAPSPDKGRDGEGFEVRSRNKAMRHPRKPGALAPLELRDDEAIGTSGDYQRYFMLGDTRYCHLIDPRSGHPAQDVQAATVLTRGTRAGVLSDAVSKPLFIAGTGGWRAAAAQMNLPEAMLVDDMGNIHLTAGLQKRLEFTDQSIHPLVE